MNQRQKFSRRLWECLLALAVFAGGTSLAQAQPHLPPGQLDQLVARVALYPDPLLAQVLTASTYADQIPEASRWSDHHHYLSGDALAAAINADHLSWDPSVQALLPFPSLLDTMARDMAWTSQLGDAVLAQRNDVMDAVQRERKKAWDFGYLRSNAEIVVGEGPYISILPARGDYYVVPFYDPAVVFVAPRPGFAVGAAISFGYGISLGAAFRPWGWGAVRFGWDTHGWFIGDRPWERTWANRTTYVHPYTVQRFAQGKQVESHQVLNMSAKERDAARMGRTRVEEHKK